MLNQNAHQNSGFFEMCVAALGLVQKLNYITLSTNQMQN